MKTKKVVDTAEMRAMRAQIERNCERDNERKRERKRRRESGEVCCDLNCNHWLNTNHEYSDGDPEAIQCRAAQARRLHPDHAERFGTFEDWSEDEAAYLLEELRGGHRKSCPGVVCRNAYATAAALNLGQAFACHDDIDNAKRHALYHTLLHGLLEDLDQHLDMEGEELGDTFRIMARVLGPPEWLGGPRYWPRRSDGRQ